MVSLDWLPVMPDWQEQLAAAANQAPRGALASFQALANSRMDFVREGKLDRALARFRSQHDLSSLLNPLKLAMLGSSTLAHLLPGMRVGALRRGLLLDIYQAPYGMYRQEVISTASDLYAFKPDVVLFTLDAHHLTEAEDASAESILQMMTSCWTAVREGLGASVIQQTLLPVLPRVVGNQEAKYPASSAAIVDKVNEALRGESAAHGIHLLTVDSWAAEIGIREWFDPSLWFRTKQEIHPRASCMYGDQVGRILGALRGKSSKCLVLDLDNTLWGGVVGDDGVEGIAIGQGSETGEAFLAMQRYAKQLSQRGVILAVCSKNDDSVARSAFAQRAEMVLKQADFACFLANWDDKALNLRRISERLQIGLDSLVFVDDNPFERNLIRRELPMVAVPELPEDPGAYVPCIAAAGYFEALTVTTEDHERREQYAANQSRRELQNTVTDMNSFLQALKMSLTWGTFHQENLKRVVQLVNKTNQFNLTTRRYLEEEIQALTRREDVLTLQFRLNDIYGDNGIIAVVIGEKRRSRSLWLETWLMSCRVLGRQVEQAAFNVVARQARAMECEVLTGVYRPSASNGMVMDHYRKLGFQFAQALDDKSTLWTYPLDRFEEVATEIQIVKEEVDDAARHLQAAY